mmetsp:Transcript_33285/g.54773  ORF Transcript_33285/g.54773 Transcript_33285/m.54773 type:complete len:260 (+) Transcript_33285:1-780(+)
MDVGGSSSRSTSDSVFSSCFDSGSTCDSSSDPQAINPRMLTVTWMWGDAGHRLAGHGLAKRNPFRWSAPMSVEDATCDLQGRLSANRKRPIKLELRMQPSNSAVQEVFSNADSAIAGLQKYVSDLGDANPGNFLGSAAEAVNVLQGSHLTDQSTPTARWMWADTGLAAAVSPALQALDANNPLNWSQWSNLEEAVLDLDGLGDAGASRPVLLHIKIKSMRYEECFETAAAATRFIQGILEITSQRKDKQEDEHRCSPDF